MARRSPRIASPDAWLLDIRQQVQALDRRVEANPPRWHPPSAQRREDGHFRSEARRTQPAFGSTTSMRGLIPTPSSHSSSNDREMGRMLEVLEQTDAEVQSQSVCVEAIQAERDEQIRRLQEKLRQSEKYVHSVVTACAEKEKENDRLRKQLEEGEAATSTAKSTKDRLAQAESSLLQAKETMNTLQKQLREKEEDQEKLQQENQAMEKSQKEWKAEVDLWKQYRRWEEIKSTSQHDIQRLEREVDKVCQERDYAKQVSERAVQQASQLQARLARLAAETRPSSHSKLMERMSEKELALEQAQDQVGLLQEQVQQLEIKVLEAQPRRVQAELMRKQEQVEELEEMNKELAKECQELRERFVHAIADSPSRQQRHTMNEGATDRLRACTADLQALVRVIRLRLHPTPEQDDEVLLTGDLLEEEMERDEVERLRRAIDELRGLVSTEYADSVGSGCAQQ